jgi:hypothetical protein
MIKERNRVEWLTNKMRYRVVVSSETYSLVAFVSTFFFLGPEVASLRAFVRMGVNLSYAIVLVYSYAL